MTPTRTALVAALLLAGCAPRTVDMRLPTPQPAEPVRQVASAEPVGQIASVEPVRQIAPAEPVNPGKTYQWMGSGEAAALSRQGWQALTRFVLAAAKARPADSVVLADGTAPDAPRFVPCSSKPPAIVLDMDETSILNTGANYDTAHRGDPPFDAARWDAWEKNGGSYVEPVPGAVEAIAAIRSSGVTPIWISNRRNSNAAGAAAALQAAGLGDAEAGETLLLQGDVAPGSGKDPRRASIAAKYCVLAMGGDQLGDFSDLFNAKGLPIPARRALAQAPAIRDLWGKGWFLMPNPLYGPGVAGTFDDIFPADKRWPGPQTEKK